MSGYIVEGRASPAFRWRPVVARPHGEPFPFNPTTRVLTFGTAEAAETAATMIRRSNAGEYRVTAWDDEATPLCPACIHAPDGDIFAGPSRPTLTGERCEGPSCPGD